VKLDVVKGRKLVGSVSGTAKPGRNTVKLPSKIKKKKLSKGTYTLKLTIVAGNNKTATDSVKLAVTG
jgi:hypothetical protein